MHGGGRVTRQEEIAVVAMSPLCYCRGVGLEKIAENRIRQAIADGEFDDLPRRGPIDLEEYFKLPQELRLAYSVLKGAGCVPEEVELLKEIGRCERAVRDAGSEPARIEAVKQLENTRLRLALVLERARRK